MLEIINCNFEFTSENLAEVEKILNRYPVGMSASALIPLLTIAQKQNYGWLSKDVLVYIADFLSLPMIHVYEVASFYSMFYLKPVGQYVVQVCTTTPCWLRNSDDLLRLCKSKLNIEVGQTTQDKKFTLIEVECLGACTNAPVIQINEDYHEKVDEKKLDSILNELSK